MTVFLIVILCISTAEASAYSWATDKANHAQNWPMLINNYNNSRFIKNSLVNSSDVSSLHEAWVSDTKGRVTGQPVVSNGSVYFGDWSGNVYSVNLTSGSTIWSADLSSLTGHGYRAQISSTLAVWNGDVYGGMSPYGPNPIVFALNQLTGKLIWEDNLTKSQFGGGTNMPSIWASPIIYNGLLYIGTAAFNESLAFERGDIFALNAKTGVFMWKFQTMIGVSGGSPVWGSPVIDPGLNSIYFGTGNAYTNKEPNGYSYSIISLNAETGALNWNYSIHDKGDLDFGSTPNLFSVTKGGINFQAIGLGSKDGRYYVLDRTNGQLLSKRLVIANGSSNSGIFGLAGFVYSQGNPEIFIPGVNNLKTCTSACGQVKSYFPNSGKIMWIYNDTYPIVGSVTVVVGAVLFSDNGGFLTALSTQTGMILFRQQFGGSPAGAQGGITVVDNKVIFGTNIGVFALNV